MSTIIIVILGITLLTLGLILIRGVFGKIQDITKTTFEDADKQIRQYMSSGNTKFYILGADTTMSPKTSQRMYVGIRNTKGKDDKFNLKIKSADGKSIVSWIEVPKEPLSVNAGDYKTIVMNIKVPGEGAVSGETYTYLVEAYTSDGKMYDSDYLTLTIE